MHIDRFCSPSVKLFAKPLKELLFGKSSLQQRANIRLNIASFTHLVASVSPIVIFLLSPESVPVVLGSRFSIGTDHRHSNVSDQLNY